MSTYTVFGTLNTLFIFVSLYGVYSQLTKIWRRKADCLQTEAATDLLSLNQFSISFLAYFSFFVYGYSIAPFNHFIVWPRLLASCLVAAIIFEICRERRTSLSYLVASILVGAFVLGLYGLVYGQTFQDQSRTLSTALILVVTILIAQGYAHQIRIIWLSGRTGAVDLKMSQFILMMDMSSIALGLSMGMSSGWPIVLLASVSGVTKVIIMYLFYWVRTNQLAQHRRNLIN